MIDDIDEKLVKLLAKDARQSSAALARELHVSPRTVRRRLKELKENRDIRNVVLVNPAKFGYPVVAIIAFNVVPGKVKAATEDLAKRPEVKWITSTAGHYDILTMARFHSTDELSDFMEQELSTIQGIKSSEAFFCLSVKKGLYMPL